MSETPKINHDLNKEKAKGLDLNELIEQSLANHGLNKVEGLEIKHKLESDKSALKDETKALLNDFLGKLKNGEWGGLKQAFTSRISEPGVVEEESEPLKETEAEIQERLRKEAEEKKVIEQEVIEKNRIDKLKNDKVTEINKNEELKEKVIDEIDKLELKKEDHIFSDLKDNEEFKKWFDEFDKDEGVSFDDVEIKDGKINFSFDDNWYNEDYNKGKFVNLKSCLDDKGEFNKENFIEEVKKTIPEAIEKMPKEKKE